MKPCPIFILSWNETDTWIEGGLGGLLGSFGGGSASSGGSGSAFGGFMGTLGGFRTGVAFQVLIWSNFILFIPKLSDKLGGLNDKLQKAKESIPIAGLGNVTDFLRKRFNTTALTMN